MRMELTYASTSLPNLSAAATMPHRAVKIIPLEHPSPSTPSSPPQLSSAVSKWTARMKQKTFDEWIEMFVPCYRWIRIYNWNDYLQADLMAGVTVGVMLVPQSMSYAKLAGLQPIYGLYSGFVPIFVYAIFGSSRQLAIGPVALVSLLVSNVLGSIVDPSDDLYTELAILLALMVGIMECVMGLLRLGWLIRFISHSVISGFTTSSAIVIALSQAKYFLGYDVDGSSKIIPVVTSIINGWDKFLWQPFIMGSFILAILLIMKHLGKTRKNMRFLRAAGPLTAVVVGTAFVKIFHPSSISLVGNIPQGLPKFSIPKDLGHATSLIPTAMLITGVAILESVGIAKALAAKNGYELDSNQECALAAIVISAVVGLVDYDEAIFLWRVDKKDFLLWTLTSLTTLFLGIEIGVLVGVGFSLAFVIHESANPHIAVLGRLPGTTVYRNIRQYPEAYKYSGIVVVRIDAPIYFANISYIKDRLREYELEIDEPTRRGPEMERVYFVILEMAPVTYIDSSANQALKDLYIEYRSRNIQLAISNPNRDVLLSLTRSGVVDLIGKEWYFVRVHDAVQTCLQHVQSLNGSPKTPEELESDYKPNLFHRVQKQRTEDFTSNELEWGVRQVSISKETNPSLEPLLQRKP
ncbi:hypothetical protein AgCh_035279 [Apium graveolens]